MSNVGRSEMSIMSLYGKSYFNFRMPLYLSAVVLLSHTVLAVMEKYASPLQ